MVHEQHSSTPGTERYAQDDDDSANQSYLAGRGPTTTGPPIGIWVPATAHANGWIPSPINPPQPYNFGPILGHSGPIPSWPAGISHTTHEYRSLAHHSTPIPSSLARRELVDAGELQETHLPPHLPIKAVPSGRDAHLHWSTDGPFYSGLSSPTTSSITDSTLAHRQPSSQQPTTGCSQSSRLPRAKACNRWKLHMRQQPRAARAGPDGKDRRTIDPPPVLQLLVDDFNVEQDSAHLRETDWVVHARLMSADGKEDMMTQNVQGENGEGGGLVRLLLGIHVASPLFCATDPHPESAVRHPVTRLSPSNSPSLRFIPTSRAPPRDTEAYKQHPGTFFIFPDMSVRRAGQYKLCFRLMKMGDMASKRPGSTVPIISEIMSDTFNVVNAKDFDQVQPSTPLIRGLVEHGAGYPLKLKKGYREGQRRRTRAGETDDDDDEEDD